MNYDRIDLDLPFFPRGKIFPHHLVTLWPYPIRDSNPCDVITNKVKYFDIYPQPQPVV